MERNINLKIFYFHVTADPCEYKEVYVCVYIYIYIYSSVDKLIFAPKVATILHNVVRGRNQQVNVTFSYT